MDENEILEGIRKAVADALAKGIKPEAIKGVLKESLGEEEPHEGEGDDKAEQAEAEGAFGYKFK